VWNLKEKSIPLSCSAERYGLSAHADRTELINRALEILQEAEIVPLKNPEVFQEAAAVRCKLKAPVEEKDWEELYASDKRPGTGWYTLLDPLLFPIWAQTDPG
jgi:hypothetical protein